MKAAYAAEEMQRVARECEETKQRVEREAVESLLKLKAQLETQKEDKRQLETDLLAYSALVLTSSK